MTHHLVGMAEIAEMLGVTRQRVAQLVESYEDFPAPEAELAGGRVWSRTAVETWIANHPERGPKAEHRLRFASFVLGRPGGQPFFERFTDRARRSVVQAQEQARLLNHDYIGTEHLLLGLLVIGEGIAHDALAALGVTAESVKARVVDRIGEGAEMPKGHIPFTPRSKKVLELALREALQLGHNYVGTEHILLGLQREDEGLGWQIMAADHELSAAAVRTEVLERLAALPTLKPLIQFPGVNPSDGPQCSFCGKTRATVGKLIAGPDVYICDECIAACGQIVDDIGKGETAIPSAPSTDRATLIALQRQAEELAAKVAEALQRQAGAEEG